MFKKVVKVLKHPLIILVYFMYKGFFNFLNDKLYIKLEYYLLMKKQLNLKSPSTFNEKLQWLKLYDRNPLYTKLVDKYEVKKYIADELGEEYIIPTLGVWDRFDDIDFDKLPNEFIMKTTHDSGTYIICKDKANFNYEEAKKLIDKRLKRDYYKVHREWPYKHVRPRIIVEKLLETENRLLPVDYKFFCFNGIADCVMLCLGRGTSETKFYFFDKNWKLLRYNIAGEKAPENFSIPKPEMIDKMFDVAEKLSENIPFVRIDLYCEYGKIYFGEFTLYPTSGYDYNLLLKTDEIFGKKIQLKEYQL